MTRIFRCLFGSHLYGLDTPESDHDYKEIYIPKIEDVILNKYKETINSSSNPTSSKNTNEDIDTEVFAVMKYMKLLLQGQAVAIDMFFAPDNMILHQSPEWDYIKARKHLWLHKNISPYVGYCRQQANKYGIKGSRVASTRALMNFFNTCDDSKRVGDYKKELSCLDKENEHMDFITIPTRQNGDGELLFECCNKKYQMNLKIKNAKEYATKHFTEYGNRALQAEKNENVDWKSLSHAVRVADEAIELLHTHHIEFPLKNKDLILEIKKGNIDYKVVAGIIEDKFIELEEAMNNSTLPEKPNYEAMEDLILELYNV